MRTVLKFIGFLLAMMAFGVYGQFVQVIFTSAAKANAGIGLVVAAIFYPVAIPLASVLGEGRTQCHCLSFRVVYCTQDCQHNR